MDSIGASSNAGRFEGIPRDKKQVNQSKFISNLSDQRKSDLAKRIGGLHDSIGSNRMGSNSDVMFDHYASSRDIQKKLS